MNQFEIISMIIVGISVFIYGISLLSKLKEEDEYKNPKRFGYSILVTVGIILVSTAGYQIVLYNRLNKTPRLPELPRFSPFASPISSNRTTNV